MPLHFPHNTQVNREPLKSVGLSSMRLLKAASGAKRKYCKELGGPVQPVQCWDFIDGHNKC